MARFHLATPAALLVNPLLMVPLSVAMISGFGLLLFGWLLPPLGAVCGLVCDRCLGVLEWSIASTAAAPGEPFLGAGAARLVAGRLLSGTGLDRAGSAAAAAGPLALGAVRGCGAGSASASLGWDAARGGRLDCTFVSVGHGCGVVVELPGGRVIVSDAGRLGSPLVGAREISGYLWSRGLTHIDAIVISHNDTDHFNAVPELLEQFSVGAIYVSPVMFNRDTGALRTLQQAIAAAGVPLRETAFGDSFITGDRVTIRVLHPPPQGMGRIGKRRQHPAGDRSLAGRRILLTGDLTSPGLEAVTAEPAPAYDVAMVPHHGSSSSDPPQFAAWCQAHWAVISGDLAHDSRKAVAAYQKAGSIVLNTATAGAVHVGISAAGEIHVDCYRRGDRW